MPDEPIPSTPPVLSYILGNLTREEAEELQRRALDDQALFDEILDASEEREMLQNPAVRARLLRRLEAGESPVGWERFRQWFAMPTARYFAAAAMALTLAIALYLGLRPGGFGGQTFEPLGIVTTSVTNAGEFFKLPLHDKRAATIALEASAVFHPGDIVRATVRLKRAGALFILRRRPDGQAQLVFPSDPQTSADRKPGEFTVPFDAVPPTADIRASEKVQIRVFLLPTGVDLRTQSIDWKKLGPDYAAVETSYTVAP